MKLAATVVAVLLIILGVVYITVPAGSLPSFIPGFEAGSTAIHVKHAIAAFVVGIAVFIGGRFAAR